MGVVSDIIRQEKDDTLSFGNYLSHDKLKKTLGGSKPGEDTYKCKTHNEITRFERNDKMLLETVPGSSIHNFREAGGCVSFDAEGLGSTQFTLELSPNTDYTIFMDGEPAGSTRSNQFGKLSFGRELGSMSIAIAVEKSQEIAKTTHNI